MVLQGIGCCERVIKIRNIFNRGNRIVDAFVPLLVVCNKKGSKRGTSIDTSYKTCINCTFNVLENEEFQIYVRIENA